MLHFLYVEAKAMKVFKIFGVDKKEKALFTEVRYNLAL